jgi:hypothetical protein
MQTVNLAGILCIFQLDLKNLVQITVMRKIIIQNSSVITRKKRKKFVSMFRLLGDRSNVCQRGVKAK